MNEDDFYSLIGRGFVSNMNKKSPKMLAVIKLASLVFSLLLLVGYAFLLFFLDNDSKMGIVIGISVACMDVFNYLLYSTKMIENTASVIVLLIFNRVTMVILGE